MSVKAVVDVVNVEVDTTVSPMLCQPYVAIWIPGWNLFQGFLTGAEYEATALGAADANAGIVAAAKALLEAGPYNIVFGMTDTVQLARGING